MGARFVMVTVVIAAAESTCPSFTMSVTVKVPRVAYVWLGAARVEVPPSPNVQR